jgi:ABC-2 type transport system permease protein
MTEILAAEWHKLRTARPTRFIVGVMAMFTVLMLVIAWYFVTTWDSLPPGVRARSSLAYLPELLGWIASLCMAVFGALAVTTEHATGMLATTFLAMPSRRRVVVAKALLVAAVSFVVTEGALVVTHVGGVLIIAGRTITGQPPGGTQVLVLIVAIGLSSTGFALIGLGLGAISRSALATVVALMLLWYIAPLLAAHIPEPWSGWIMSIMPGALAGEIAGNGNVDSVFRAELSPFGAILALAAYAILPIGAAMAVVGRRDA